MESWNELSYVRRNLEGLATSEKQGKIDQLVQDLFRFF